jgi:hypothetical protein
MPVILFTDKDIAKWMNSAPAAWKEWLEQEIGDHTNQLMGASEILVVGRFQGALHILNTLKRLREES